MARKQGSTLSGIRNRYLKAVNVYMVILKEKGCYRFAGGRQKDFAMEGRKAIKILPSGFRNFFT